MTKAYTGPAMLTMRLEPPCSSGERVFLDTIHNAISVADKLQVIVMVKMNDVDMMFFPGDDVHAKLEFFHRAQNYARLRNIGMSIG